MLNSLNLPAPAKVNLVLEVLGRREDGYHGVDTIVQTLQLSDAVGLRPHVDAQVTVSGPCREGTPTDRTNLAWRAAEELASLTDVGGPYQIAIEKQIPPASGLGGGASDAAAVLRLLQRATPGTTDEQLLAAASAVGSDPPFFLTGGTARATGRGELVSPLPPLPEHGVVLFVPPETLERKTARMFAALDELPFDDGTVSESFVRNPPASIRTTDIFNAFERVAFDMFPWLAELWEDLETRIGEPIRLAGAGPTLFWIGPPAEAASVAARAEGLPCTVIPTRTRPSMWRQ